MTWIFLPLIIALGLSLAMAGAWAIARRPGQSGWTDAIWSFATGGAGVVAALWPLGTVPDLRQGLVAALAGLWGGRLGWHIAQRTLAHSDDDPRYAALRAQWGDRFDRRLFRFLQAQAVAGWVLAMAVLLAAHNPAPLMVWSDGVGAALAVLALAGEALADWQLRAYRRNPAHAGGICDTGLWSLSRHPNYFFEWLGWLALAVIAIGPAGAFAPSWLALAGPAMIYWLLVHVSGIPPLEAHMLRSRGEAYRAVQRRIRAFWPIPL
ncbi:MAG: hypothetical protein RLZZ136_1611 [Pseudomonadota bacterium]|jgi:steroid 5-alpha reductase family enzyme